jgi:putative inorganic carbon (HCO3(-)) transporter
MRDSDYILKARTSVPTSPDENRRPGGTQLLTWLPLLLGVGLGPVLAFLITGGNWIFAIAAALAVPMLILFSVSPFGVVIIWLLLMPFESILPAADQIHWVLHRLMIPAALVLIVLSRLLRVKKYPSVRLGPAELAMGAYLGFVIINILIRPIGSLSDLFRISYDRISVPFCAYLLMRLTAPRERELKLLLAVALFVAISQSVIGFLSWFVPQVLPPQWFTYYGTERTTGSLLDANVYTSVLVFCITLLFQAAMNRKPDLTRIVFLIACGLGTICVVFSFERGSWLGAVFAAVGLLVMFPKTMLRVLAVLTVGLVILGGGALARQSTWAFTRMQDQRTINDRIVVTDAMLQMIKIKPFWGWGYESVDRYSMQFYKGVGDAPPLFKYITSHNTYLTIFVDFGFLGLGLYLFPMLWWGWLTIKVFQRMPKEGLWSRTLVVALWLAALHQVIVSNFMDMRFFPITLTLWWMTLGLVANMVYPYLKPNDLLPSQWVCEAGSTTRIR